MWLTDAAEPSVRVDVTQTFDRKLEPLRAYASRDLEDSLVRAAPSIGPAEHLVRLGLRRRERCG